MASFIAIIRYALLETFFCISILAKTRQGEGMAFFIFKSMIY
jgi:hypothetical protein